MHAEHRDGGVWLNDVASGAFNLRLRFCDKLPDLARAIADTRVGAAVAVANEQHTVDLAQDAATIAELKRERWSPLQRAGAVFSGAVVGAAIGFLAARVMR